MERVINSISRCTATYSRLRHLKNLQRSAISTTARCQGRFEPDGQKLEPDIPEYAGLSLRLQGHDYVILEAFAKHVHKMTKYFDLDSDNWPVPAFKQRVSVLKPKSKVVTETLILNTYERIVQIEAVPSVKLPIFLEFLRNNCPQSVTVTVKEATEDDEEFRYVPDLEKIELQAKLAELTPARRK